MSWISRKKQCLNFKVGFFIDTLSWQACRLSFECAWNDILLPQIGTSKVLHSRECDQPPPLPFESCFACRKASSSGLAPCRIKSSAHSRILPTLVLRTRVGIMNPVVSRRLWSFTMKREETVILQGNIALLGRKEIPKEILEFCQIFTVW